LEKKQGNMAWMEKRRRRREEYKSRGKAKKKEGLGKKIPFDPIWGKEERKKEKKKKKLQFKIKNRGKKKN
jgi:hypothetical protein